jgi:SAM-dependent methyltransferase
MTELLIGCGSDHGKRFTTDGNKEWTKLVTLDINPDHKPDVLWDLTKRPLPFEDNAFEEIHAYEVLEHLGQQGDWRTFFEEWSEWWRILKPNGIICGTSPAWNSPWAWGDPGHTRIMSAECLTFLVQPEYTKQVGKSPMTDYRFVYRADFDPEMAEIKDGHLVFAMKAIKPSRITI